MPFPPSTFTSADQYKDSFISDIPKLGEYVKVTQFYEIFDRALQEAGFVFNKSDFSPEENESGSILPLSVVSSKTPYEIYRLCFTFWRLLPDRREIHRPFFNRLCDYCSEWGVWESSCETPDEAELDGYKPVTLV
jgi:hypothetical protein